MIRRSTWIIICIFLLLLLGILVWSKVDKNDTLLEPTSTSVIQAPVLDIVDHEIIGIQINENTGVEVMYERGTPTNIWTISGLPDEQINQEQMEQIVSSLIYLTPDATLQIEPPLEAMGLITPDYKILVTLENGEIIYLDQGNLVPTGGAYYVKVDDNPVIVVNQTDLDLITSGLITPPLQPTSNPDSPMNITPATIESPKTITTPAP